MLKIRLHRTGKTKRPHYRVVVAEHERAAQGTFVQSLGFWDPLKAKLELKEDEVKKWMDKGAKPTDRISRLLKKHGMKHKHIVIHERPARGPKEAKEGKSEGEKGLEMSKPAEEATQKVAEESALSESQSAQSDEKSAKSEVPTEVKAQADQVARPDGGSAVAEISKEAKVKQGKE